MKRSTLLSFKYFLVLLLSSLMLLSCSKNSTKGNNSSSSSSKTNAKSSKGEAIVKTAKKYIGTKYKYGGISKSGIDCSGLIYVVFKEHNMTMPRISRDQATKGKAVYIGELKAGDLIFFGATNGSKKITHAGIVSFSNGKDIKFIHSSSSKGVMESDLAGYWKPKYIKARRVL